jgi:hypothetical protein
MMDARGKPAHDEAQPRNGPGLAADHAAKYGALRSIREHSLYGYPP